MIQSVHFRQHL